MKNDATTTVRRLLAQHGVPDAVSVRVQAWLSPSGDDERPRANLTIGHGIGSGRRETATISFPNEDALLEHIGDRERVAAFLCLGVGAMPSSERPELPDWISSSEGARRTRSDLRRASTLADGACRGEFRDADGAMQGTPF